MKAYYIAQMVFSEGAEYVPNKSSSASTIEDFGGKILAADSDFATLSGELDANRIIIIEFPSEERLREWYYSPEYEKVKAVRDPRVQANISLVHGK